MVKQIEKICIVTGSRAEYGLLKWLIKDIKNLENLEIILIATGSHLSHEFGFTINEIIKDGFNVNEKVDILLSTDTPNAISKSVGIGVMGFADKFEHYKPDLLLILGDRYEIYSAAIAAMIARIPIAHIHGGESTEGAIDEAIRHSITKISHLHFVASNEYRNRVIQLGEDPSRVFNVGALGIDGIKRLKLRTKEKLEKLIGFQFGLRNLLVTFHPVTLENDSSEKHINELLESINEFEEINFIFTMPNADMNSRIIYENIEKFCKKSKNAFCFKSLGQLNYFSCLKFVDGVIGNSSSGIIEVPSFLKGTINIGNRQTGRLKSKSIIDCNPSKLEIKKAINKLYSKNFQDSLKYVINPYGDGEASKKIIEKIKNINLDGILIKKFYDLP